MLIGYKLEDFNAPGTMLLNWKVVRNTMINESFIDKVLEYPYQGPKDTPVSSYQYINRIKARLANIVQEDVNNYNLGLGRLFLYLTLVVSLRIQDIIIRREERENLKKEIEAKTEEERLRVEKLENDIATKKEELAEDEEFDEDAERADLEERFPPIEIPVLPPEELDLDLEENPEE